jgi:DNA-binding MarR family transcriptional regulator
VSPSIGEHVGEFERLGYVERVPAPSNHRAKLIRPTTRGLAFMAVTHGALADVEREWSSAVGKETLAQPRDDLSAIRSRQQQTGYDLRASR